MSLDHMQSLAAPYPSHQDSESELDHHHIKEDLCRHCGVTNELQILPQDASRERRKFSHTSKIQREKLIDMITTQNYSIKKVNPTPFRPQSSPRSPTAPPRKFSSGLEPNSDVTSHITSLLQIRPDTSPSRTNRKVIYRFSARSVEPSRPREM